jgi:hypothetical protein
MPTPRAASMLEVSVTTESGQEGGGPTSGLGRKAPSVSFATMSALPSNADIRNIKSNVWKGPRSRLMRCSKVKLFDHLIGGHLERRWDREAKRFGGPHVDSEIEARGALER